MSRYNPKSGPFHLSNVGDLVWVGDRHACQFREQFDGVIHVEWPNITESHFCPGRNVSGLTVRWDDPPKTLDTLSVPFPEIMAYAARPGTLLVHCAAGVCRSASLAVAAKIARGRLPWDAVRDVYAGTWARYGYCPLLNNEVMNGVFRWFDAQTGPVRVKPQ